MGKVKNYTHTSLVVGAMVGIIAGLVVVANYNSDEVRTSLLADATSGTATTTDQTIAPTTPTVDPKSTVNTDLQQMQDTLKWNKNDYENRVNETKNFKGQDTSALTSLLTQWKSKLNEMETAANSGDSTTFWDLNQEEDDISMSISDNFQGQYAVSDMENFKRTIKDTTRNLKDREREIKNIQRNKGDTSALETILTELKSILAQMETIANTPTSGMATEDIQDLTRTGWDLNTDFNDKTRDFSDLSQELNEQSNAKEQIKNAERNLKDKNRTVKDNEREYKRLVKEVGENALLTELAASIQRMKDMIAQIQTAITNNDTDTLNYGDQDFWDENQIANDIKNELNESSNQERQNKDLERVYKEKQKQLKDAERECKRVKCEGTPSGELLNRLREILAQMGQIIATQDYEGFWDINSEYDTTNQEFYNLANNQRSTKDIGRWIKDVTREMKDKGKWLADMEREAKRGEAPFTLEEVAELQAIYDQMIAALKKAEGELSSNPQGANDIMNYEFNELRARFDEITQSFQGRRDEGFFQFELENLAKEIENAYGQVDQKLAFGEIDQAKADLCTKYLVDGQDLLEKLQQIQAEGKMNESEELKIRLEKIGNQSDRDCGDVYGIGGPDHEGAVQYYVKDDLQGMAEEMFSRINEKIESEFMNRIVEKLGQYENVINTMLEEVGNRWQKQVEATLETMAFVDEDHQENLLKQKTRMLEKLQSLDDKVSEKTQELEDLENKIAGYNFYGDAGSELEDDLEEALASGINSSKIRELQGKADEAIKKAKVEKFERGVTPFRDTDDNEWFTRYVSVVADKGIVTGKSDAQGNLTGYFDPGAQVTIAESLKMALEVFGEGQASGTPSFAQAKNHWAAGYVKQAENIGLSIDLNNLNRPATRAEVIEMIMEIADVPLDEISDESSFSDVPDGSRYAKYVEAAKAMGIISGDSGRNTFRPNEGINRAETAKVINNVLTTLVGDEEGGSEGGLDQGGGEQSFGGNSKEEFEYVPEI
ncbi:MAG: S-layer homology domain-containing protein [Patescibacteria group bacterium]